MRRALKQLVGFIACFVVISSSAEAAEKKYSAAKQISQLEQKYGGRIGVAAWNTANNQKLAYHAYDRFPLCSTFKFLLAAAILARVDEKTDRLTDRIAFGASDILDYAPITKTYLSHGSMTIAELAGAAMTHSDNTAANVLLAHIGGPEKLTEYVRSLGDSFTRVDRNEPSLNSNEPNDPRDTTTPAAMIYCMRMLLLNDRLSESSRMQLTAWMVANTTGDKKLRAGIPAGWKIGDKTGSGANAASSDIAMIWPSPSDKPIFMTVYYTNSTATVDEQNAVIAQIGRIVTTELTR